MGDSAGSGSAQQSPKRVSFPRPRFVLFGDSLTEWSFRTNGWGSLLADRYARKADIVLRGYCGYNTRWALHLLDHVFPLVGMVDAKAPPPPSPPPPPALVTVFFGANDCALADGFAAFQHVPLEEYRANLCKIVQHLQRMSMSTVIVLVAPPPIDAPGFLNHLRAEQGRDIDDCGRTNESARLYAEACAQVAAEMKVAVINLWELLQEGGRDWKSCLCDGLHFSEAGNAVVFEALMRVLAEEGGGRGAGDGGGRSLVAEEMAMDFPSFDEVDPVNHAETFTAWIERRHRQL